MLKLDCSNYVDDGTIFPKLSSDKTFLSESIE
jgi:hypothetical protein